MLDSPLDLLDSYCCCANNGHVHDYDVGIGLALPHPVLYLNHYMHSAFIHFCVVSNQNEMERS
jgi:hypothetical protein